MLGIGAQWLAWRLHLPAILVLLLTGFVAGPLTGYLNPDQLLGDLLLPLVSLAVALILFEGGLSLRLGELRGISKVVRNLVSIGALATWFIATVAARFLLGFDLPLALLLGAILIVTGPTVIGPLLRHVRPRGPAGAILKWEGIVIDPVGAMLAVVIYEAILIGSAQQATTLAALWLLKTVLVGGAAGLLGAGGVVVVLKRYWVPEFLHEAITLTAVIASFTASNLLQAEAGLLAVTIMGLVLANQRAAPVRHIIEFKENLRVLLISSLFILLAARLEVAQLIDVGWEGLAFLAVLVVVARPLSVALSTIGSELSWPERIFLLSVAPRGIVAASVASVFALGLSEAGTVHAEKLVPVTFLVIVGTATIYGLTAPPLGRRLGVAQQNPQGVLLMGGHRWARSLAGVLQAEGYAVYLADTNWANLAAARLAGLPAYYGSLVSENALGEIDLAGIGRLLALTANDEANSLAALHFAEIFSREEVYQLSPDGGKDQDAADYSPLYLRGRFLFGGGIDHGYFTRRERAGATIKVTSLSEEFGIEAFRQLYGESALPLFLINDEGELEVVTADGASEPRVGQRLISMVDPLDANGGAGQ